MREKTHVPLGLVHTRIEKQKAEATLEVSRVAVTGKGGNVIWEFLFAGVFSHGSDFLLNSGSHNNLFTARIAFFCGHDSNAKVAFFSQTEGVLYIPRIQLFY
jgi:hypothetical protein